MPPDTSTPAQRAAFAALVEAGRPTVATAAAVQNCLLPMPLGACVLLGLAENATYAQSAAACQFRWSQGEPVA
jgi:hypothetical protein